MSVTNTIQPKTGSEPVRKHKSGPQKALEQLGLIREIDRALHLPLRYEDETRLYRLFEAPLNQPLTQVEGEVTHQEVPPEKTSINVTIYDGSGSCTVYYFNRTPNLVRLTKVGARIRVRGTLEQRGNRLSMVHPATTMPAGAPLSKELTPIYPAASGLNQNYLRKVIDSGLSRADLSETIAPEYLDMIPALRTFSLIKALYFLHHPPPNQSLHEIENREHPAWQRIKAEELLAQQISQLGARREREQLQAPILVAQPGGLPDKLLAALPFKLTGAQNRCVKEIEHNMGGTRPMLRLLQGDVGAGKTIVAAMAAATAIDAGWQCALMAPTEILAEQHFYKLTGWLEPLLAPLGKRVAWLTGGQKKRDRAAQLESISNGDAMLVVGTHAVIGQEVQFAHLGLAVIDEQHRFGVQQRLQLRRKLSEQPLPQTLEPHFLMMSATPIPRTLAMSYYADLDVSIIDELPPGRTPIVTKLKSVDKRPEIINHFLPKWVKEGRQIYWVCPLIETPEEEDEPSDQQTTMQDLKAAIEAQVELAAVLGADAVGLVHSRLRPAEKKAVMARFVAGQLPVLVATTVIEVGVDVPNASVMVIEHSERFGLAQLHQLRGRVGRGSTESACILIFGSAEHRFLSNIARDRLLAMRDTQDGFEIARRDLAIRGPGEFLGARQSGAALLRFAELKEDDPILDWAREVAPSMLDQYPELARRHAHRWLGGKSDYLKA